jgi:dCMP deaminase
MSKKWSTLKWDTRFIHLAKQVSTWSKDPSTKCGAVIVRPDNTVCSLGFNGFPRGMADTEERLNNREDKYSRVIHAEINAILFAREPIDGYTLYTWPFLTCDRCAVQVIQSGIKRVMAPALLVHDERSERWKRNIDLAVSYYNETGVEVEQVGSD